MIAYIASHFQRIQKRVFLQPQHLNSADDKKRSFLTVRWNEVLNEAAARQTPQNPST
jgi:hypothetical protein